MPDDPRRLVSDVLRVWPAGETRAWSEDLARSLGELDPSCYAGWSATDLATALARLGITTRQIHQTIDGARLNRRGVDRAVLLAVAGERHGGSPSRDCSSRYWFLPAPH